MYEKDSDTVIRNIGIFFYVNFDIEMFGMVFRRFPIAFLQFIRYNIAVSLFIF